MFVCSVWSPVVGFVLGLAVIVCLVRDYLKEVLKDDSSTIQKLN